MIISLQNKICEIFVIFPYLRELITYQIFMRLIFALFFCLTLAEINFAQTQFWSDNFEDVGAPSSGTRTPSQNFSCGSPATNYFFRTDNAGIALQAGSYSGMQGSKFWAGEDIDFGPTCINSSISYSQQITWSGINITGKTGISFRGLFAANGASPGTWEGTAFGAAQDLIIVEYRIDGGGWNKTIQFASPAATPAQQTINLDADFDALGEGTALGYAFQEFITSISGTGTTLDLRLTMSANNSATEEMAVDNFRLFEAPACSNPVVNINPANSSTCINSNTSFSIMATGATSYQWQVNSGSGFTNVANGGVYSGATSNMLTLTGVTASMNGYIYRCLANNLPCSTTSGNATLTVSNPTVTLLSQINVTCNGGNTGSVTVNPAVGGISPYTYNWGPGNPTGDGTTSIINLTAGTYTVTVTDNIGCTATVSANCTQTPVISVNALAQTNVSCNGGNNGAASIEMPTGGAGGFIYNWGPGNPSGDGTRSVTGLTAGTWTVTVTDANNCTKTVAFNILQPLNPLTLTVASQTDVSCNGGNNGAASINPPTGGTPVYTYNWTPANPIGDGTPSVTGLTVGTWTCVVTDALGCTQSQVFTINQPTAINLTQASQTNITCFGQSNGAASVNPASGGAGGFTYDWTPGNPPGDGTTAISGLLPGTYTCVVTDANGCSKSSVFNITSPSLIVPSFSSTPVSCVGGSNGSITATGSGGNPGYTYAWSTGSVSTTISNLGAGTYHVTLTDSYGCTVTASNTLSQPSFNITGNGFPIANGDITPSTSDGTDFGSQSPNSNTPHTFFINNSGITLPIDSVKSTSPVFVVSSVPASIAGNASDDIVITFSPSTNGTYIGDISIYYNSCTTPHTFRVQGSTCTNNFTFIGPGTDPSVPANWLNGCMPPVNDPVAIITINAGQTFVSTGSYAGNIVNYGIFKGNINLLGGFTNYGTVNPGN